MEIKAFETKELPYLKHLLSNTSDKLNTINEEVEKKWIKIFNRKSGGVVLDHCCGENTIEAEAKHFGYEWIGFDHAGDLATVKGDAHNLPFDDNSFDIVWSDAVLEHVYDPWKVVQEIKRVLKPNGFYIGSVAFMEPYHGHSYFHMSPRGLYYLLNKNGFEVKYIDANSASGPGDVLYHMFPFSPMKEMIWNIGKFLLKVRYNLIKLYSRIKHSENSKEMKRINNYLSIERLRYGAYLSFFGINNDKGNINFVQTDSSEDETDYSKRGVKGDGSHNRKHI